MPAVLDKPVVGKDLAHYETSVIPRDPFWMFDRMREEMDRLFEALPFGRVAPFFPRTETLWVPPLEVFEKEGNLYVKTDLPGLKKEDINIEVTADGLTIKGERKTELKEEKKPEGYFRSERTYGEFCRFVPLPEGALIDKVTAQFKDGVLEIVTPIPKLEKIVPKKVDIR